jgi:hypothetical protein
MLPFGHREQSEWPQTSLIHHLAEFYVLFDAHGLVSMGVRLAEFSKLILH